MQRRTYLKAALAVTAASPLLSGAEDPKGRIQLHLDLTVLPNKEKQILEHFRKVFKPAASKVKATSMWRS